MYTAGATWWRWMERRTTSGEADVSHCRPSDVPRNGCITTPHFLRNAALLLLVLLLTGCARDLSMLPEAAAADTCRRSDTIAQAAEAQLARVRADMATTRIDAAKKEATLQELRQEVEALRAVGARLGQLEVEHHRTVEAQEAELALLRKGRGSPAPSTALSIRLDPRVAEPSSAKAQSAPRAPKASRMQARVDALETSIVALTTQVRMLSLDLKGLSPVRASGRAAPAVGITVKRGDTLSKLALAHGVTVNAIQQANGLNGDLILIGQWLHIPTADASDHRPWR